MAHIDYYCATLSPFVYLAGTRLEEIARRHDAAITYRPLDVVALFAKTGGTPTREQHPARQEYFAQELRRQSQKAGLPLNLKPAHWPTNGAPAAYAIIAAQKAGGGDLGALVHGIGTACWAQECDIADDAVIRRCLEGAGFDPDLADKGLMEGAETYGRNLEDAVRAGAFGVPFYITDDDARFWGQDRLEDLDAHFGAGK